MKRSEWADRWWRQALHDMEVARVLHKEGFWDSCAFVCQQAAEKAVKAVWVTFKTPMPPKVHSVGRLARELGASEELVDGLDDLFGDYTASRYPAMDDLLPFESYEQEDSEDRLRKAQSVLQWASEQWEESDGGH